MSDTLIAAYIGAFVILTGWLTVLSFWMGKMSLKTDTMWETQQMALREMQTAWNFQMRRAATRTVQEGDATANSPLTFSPDALTALQPISAELRAFWKTWDKKSDDAATLLEIERLFGKRIYDLSGGQRSHDSSLLTALAVACDNPVIELKLA